MKFPRWRQIGLLACISLLPVVHTSSVAAADFKPTYRPLGPVQNLDIVRTMDRRSFVIEADPVVNAVQYVLRYNGRKIYEGKKPVYTDSGRALGVGVHVYSMVAVSATGKRTAPNVASYTVDPFPTMLPPIFDTPVGAVRVDLSEQMLYVYNERVIYPRLLATIQISTGTGATGRPGSTPVGSFTVWPGERGRSERAFYSSVECMDHMIRFTKGFGGGNIGFHSIPYRCGSNPRQYLSDPSTYLGIAPSSHGCIRMNDYAAAWLFRNIMEEARVTVVD